MFVSVRGFLMDTNTPSGLIGAPITDQYYIALFDKIAQEKHARRLVQQYIIGLQKELDVTKQEILTLHKQDNISCKESDISNIEKDTFILRQNANQLKADLSSLKTEVNRLKESNKQIALKNEQLKLSYVQLHQNLSVVFADNVILKYKLKDFQNATSTIVSDFQNFINSKYGRQLALLRTVQNEKDTFLPKIQTVNQQVDALKRTSSSRTQDFVAFIRGLGSLKSMINELGKSHQYIEKNIVDVNKDSSKIRKTLEVFNGHVQTHSQGIVVFICFTCNVLYIIVCLFCFVLFHLAIVLSALLRFTTPDYYIGIFNPFLLMFTYMNIKLK